MICTALVSLGGGIVEYGQGSCQFVCCSNSVALHSKTTFAKTLLSHSNVPPAFTYNRFSMTHIIPHQSSLLHIYNFCCKSIRKMPTLQSKQFSAQIAGLLFSLVDQDELEARNADLQETPSNIQKQQETVGEQEEEQIYKKQDKHTKTMISEEVQTIDLGDARAYNTPNQTKSQSDSSFKEKIVSDSALPDNDEILEQTVEKYEKLIESLYKEMEQLEADYESKIATSQSEHDQKMRQSHKSVKSNKVCSCPVSEMKEEIQRLHKEIKRRDKQKIKKIKDKLRETGKFNTVVHNGQEDQEQ